MEDKMEDLSYATDLWDGFTAVSQKAADGHKTLDKLLIFFKEKAALDYQYATTLKRLSASLFASTELGGGPTQTGLSHLDQLVQVLSKNFYILSAKVNEHVRKPLEHMRSKVMQQNRELMKNGDALQKKYASCENALDAAQVKCESLCRHYQSASKASVLADKYLQEGASTNDMMRSKTQVHALQENAEKARKKAQTLSRQAIQADRTYMSEVKQMRNFREHYDVAMSNVLGKFERVETTRLGSLGDLVKRFLQIQHTMFQSVTASTETVRQHVDKMEPTKDVRLFIASRTTGNKPPPMPEYVFPKGHPMAHMRKKAAKAPQDQPQHQQQQQRSTTTTSPSSSSSSSSDKQLAREYEHAFTHHIHTRVGIMLDKYKQHNDKDKDKEKKQEAKTTVASMEQAFKESHGRQAFASILNHARTIPNALHLDDHQYEALGTIILEFLNHAHATMHVRPAQIVMIMSQTFFKTVNDNKKVFLQAYIRNHPIWTEHRFWEEAFFDSFTQELKKHERLEKWHSDVEIAEENNRQRNILFAQLGVFAHNMTEFSMPPARVRSFIVKMCEINELKEEHVNLLLHMPCLKDSEDADEAGDEDKGKEEEEDVSNADDHDEFTIINKTDAE